MPRTFSLLNLSMAKACFIVTGVDVKGISTLLPGLKLLSACLEIFGVYCVL